MRCHMDKDFRMPAKKPDKEVKFEQAIERLSAIVAKLEDGEASLDESLQLFQEGRALGKQCSQQLADIEKKARLLIEDEKGEVNSQPFAMEGDGAEEAEAEEEETEEEESK